MMIKYRKFRPTEYVMLFEGGKIIKQGTGLSFFIGGWNKKHLYGFIFQ